MTGQTLSGGHETWPLELTGDELRQRVDDAMERLGAFVDRLPDEPASYDGDPRALARSMVEALPRGACSFDALLRSLFDDAIPYSYNTASPGYLAYIPGGGLLDSAVADLISSTINRYVGVFVAAPALAQLETNVVRWFADIVGYPSDAGGFLCSGGSLANFSAIITAKRDRLPADFLRGTLYTSDQTHHCVRKAAMLAGFPADAVREVATDDNYRIRIEALGEMVAADRKAGRSPFLVVGNAGTVNAGAVDDLEALAEFCEAQQLWFHVDGAYGGFFTLTQRGRQVMTGIERSDSIVLDPHKGLFLPYGTGALLVRNGHALRRAHTVSADYLPEMQSERDLVDFCEISPELTRPYRGLRVWLPIKLHGIGAFEQALDEKLDLARYAAERLKGFDHIEILAAPTLSLVAFRLRPPGMADHNLDVLNKSWLERINARKRVFLSGAPLAGRFALKLAVLCYRTHREHIDRALEDIVGTATELLA